MEERQRDSVQKYGELTGYGLQGRCLLLDVVKVDATHLGPLTH